MGDGLAKPLDPASTVFDWIIEGASEHELVEKIQTTWPDLKIKPMIVAAFMRISKDADADLSTVYGWCIQASRRVYQKALEASDFGAALRAIKQIRDIAQMASAHVPQNQAAKKQG